MKKHHLAIAVCSTALKLSLAVCASTGEINAGSEIQLFPAGEFRARDGRPEGIGAWRIDANVAQQLIALADARNTPFVIDYNHQTLHADKSGTPAPAAGWFTALEWREGDGLYATDVKWTPKAAEYVKNKEYRFISPVFYHADNGDVSQLLMAAITNFPALDGMDEILAAASTMFNPSKNVTGDDTVMNELLKKLLARLGLAEDATEEDAMGAVANLMSMADKAADAETKVAALSTQLATAAKVDPAKYVPVSVVEELKTQVAALTTSINTDKVTEMVAAGIADKKLLPAQKEWATDLGNHNLASLSTYLENAQSIAALSGTQTNGEERGDKKDAPSDELAACCAQLGLDPATVI
jgi:phage I-like protein